MSPTALPQSRRSFVTGLLAIVLLACSAAAQTGGWITSERTAWADVDERERDLVDERFLAAPDWPFRVLGLARLDRYRGAGVDRRIRERLADERWTVRCLALRTCRARGIDIDVEALEDEVDPRVLRAGLRCDVDFEPARIDPIVRDLAKSSVIDDRLLAAELAVLGGSDEARVVVTPWVMRFGRMIDRPDASIYGYRLARLLDFEDGFEFWAPPAWKSRLASLGSDFVVGPVTDGWPDVEESPITRLELEDLSRLADYLTGLRERDLELAIVMDVTGSMQPVIDRIRSDADALILFMRDLSRSFRLGLVAYRDYDDRPSTQTQRFTTDVRAARAFLRKQRAFGGGDYPEAVLLGLQRCGNLRWAHLATQMIVLIGDAPPHERDVSTVASWLDDATKDGRTVHTVFVKGPNASGDGSSFADLAKLGGGGSAVIDGTNTLTLTVIHFTLEEAWWPVFDAFYAEYREWCR